MTCTCEFSAWFKHYLAAFHEMPVVMLFLICIFWGNRMLRREHFSRMTLGRAALFNLPSMILFSVAIGIAFRLVFAGLA